MGLETLGRTNNIRTLLFSFPDIKPAQSLWIGDWLPLKRSWGTFLLRCLKFHEPQTDFFPGWFRLDDWLLDRMASCQHLQSPALLGRSRQLVESSSRPATVPEDQGESLEWSLMLQMEVCGSGYGLHDFFPHVSSYSAMVKRQSEEKSAQKNSVGCPRWCDPKEVTYGLSDVQSWSTDLLCASAKWKTG